MKCQVLGLAEKATLEKTGERDITVSLLAFMTRWLAAAAACTLLGWPGLLQRVEMVVRGLTAPTAGQRLCMPAAVAEV